MKYHKRSNSKKLTTGAYFKTKNIADKIKKNAQLYF